MNTYLFKFVGLSGERFEYTKDIFLNRRLYLPTVRQLNDPLEAIVNDADSDWGRSIPMHQKALDSYRILSLTEKPCDALMWAHYADSHRGICLVLDANHARLRCAEPVIYNEKPVEFSRVKDKQSQIRQALMTKSKDWAYEEEHRIIAADIAQKYIDIDDKTIVAVGFGCRMSELDTMDKNYKQLVIDWIGSYNREILAYN